MFEIHMGVPEMEEFWNVLRMTGAGRRQRLPAPFSDPNDMIVVFDASSEKADAAAACKKGESVFPLDFAGAFRIDENDQKRYDKLYKSYLTY